MGNILSRDARRDEMECDEGQRWLRQAHRVSVRLSRERGDDSEVPMNPETVLERRDNSLLVKAVPAVLGWCAFFSGVQKSMPYILSTVMPKVWAKLDSDQMTSAVSQGTAISHHLLVSLWSIAALYRDAMRRDHDRHDPAPGRSMASISLGYFFCDFIFTYKQWIAHPDFAIHHGIAIAIIMAILRVRGVTRFIPALLITEASTVLLGLMWFLRLGKQTDGAAYQVTSLLFALLFFLLRIVWMPLVVAALLTKHSWLFEQLGVIRHLFVPVIGLQVYWFSKILAQLKPTVVALLKKVGLPA